MRKRGLSFIIIIALASGAAGVSAADGSWTNADMPLCCKTARSTDDAPQVSLAGLCCKLNCSEPGSGGSGNASSLSRNQGTTADYKGKVLLINFWATWCAPCRAEIPELIRLQSKYKDQGLQIVGITYPPEEPSEVQRYVKNAKVNYPIAIGTKATKAVFTTTETLPITVVIDRDGNLKHIIEGILYSDEFDEKVKPLINTEQSSPSNK